MPTLIVTRAQGEAAEGGDADARIRALRSRGVQVQDFPLIRIVPALDPGPARAALARLEGFDLAVPVSPAAVHATLALLDRPWPAGCAVGLVGPGSRAAFEQALLRRGQNLDGLRVVSAPARQADSEGLWQALQTLGLDWGRARVLILRGGAGREWLGETLRAAGAEVLLADVYRRSAPPADAPTLRRLRELLGASAPWLLSASAAIDNLCALLRAADLEPAPALASHRALVTHARLQAAALAAGFGRVDLVTHDPDALCEALRTA